VAARLRPRERRGGAVGFLVREPPRVRHQQSRPGGDDLRRPVV